MSYHIARLRLIEPSYQVIYLMNHTPHPPYEAILAIDEEFKKIEKTLPEYYQVSSSKPMTRPKSNKDEDLVLNWEKVVCQLSLQTQWLRCVSPLPRLRPSPAVVGVIALPRFLAFSFPSSLLTPFISLQPSPTLP